MLTYSLIKRGLCLALTLCTLAACADDSSHDRFNAESIAARGKLHRVEIPAGGFILTTYARVTDLNEPLVVYIEGEDRPYSLSGSIDLAPATLPALRLATLDPAANILYIARPCQLTAGDERCEIQWIRNGRFADMVFNSVNRVINRTLAPFPAPRLHLVGHGDGGALAVLLASRRADVLSLRTVAGNLDPTGLARYLGYDGADDLIDPMPIAARLPAMPQEHYVGDKDTVVPAFLTANFLKEIGATYCATLVRVPEATHDQGWEEIWAANVANRPVCGKKRFIFNPPE